MTKNDALAAFVKDEVALDEGRVNRIKEGIRVVKGLLDNSDLYKNRIVGITPQGSFELRTGIRPVQSDHDYDVDLLFEVKPSAEFEPRFYLNELHGFFHGMDRYKDIVDRRGKTRCVTLDYATDFHIDIVPCISLQGSKYIANKNTNRFEPTDGSGYSTWFKMINARTNGHLATIVQLLKYLRDYKGNFKVKSIVLTTLLAQQVSASDPAEAFPNLLTATKLLLSRLDGFLQASAFMPDVFNPALASEKFTARNWSQEQYSNFRDKFHLYSSQIVGALNSDEKKFTSVMQSIFGSAFPSCDSGPIVNPLQRISDGYPCASEMFIDQGFVNKVANRVIHIGIDAKIGIHGFTGRMLSQIRGYLPSSGAGSLFFRAEIPPEYQQPRYALYWKVKNRGEHAKLMGQLRGEITQDAGTYAKKEDVKFVGDHYVECYLVDTASKTLIGKGRIGVPLN